MKLTSIQVKEFQEMYFKNFSVSLSDDEAKEKGLKVIRAFKLLYIPQENKNENYYQNEQTRSTKNL